MTPFAQRIVRELAEPRKARCQLDRGGLLGKMDDVHCFEVTDAWVPAINLGRDMGRSMCDAGSLDARLAFLPAPKTWIEFRNDARNRCGVLLEEQEDKCFARATWGNYRPLDDWWHSWEFDGSGLLLSKDIVVPHGDDAFKMSRVKRFQGDVDGMPAAAAEAHFTMTFYALLALINTPRVFGRRTHRPHKGLERKLLAQSKAIGKYPLNAWHEIVLEINAPKEEGGDVDGHLTGQRALHFVRSFLRVKMGKLEIVRSHWRGDAALGIKQSRYSVRA